ncbi:MAG: hypothetical protein GEU83_14275 [Pseudonocardiaceae bacterium]|nr:hypothetical protein [Pseudonocardiaceae bacterium]
MGDLRPLGDFDLSAPDTWLPLPHEGPLGWTHIAAERLCDGGRTRAKLARRLERLQPTLTADPHLMVEVWVPDRASPRVAGLLFVDWVVPDGGLRIDREYYRGLIEPDRRSGVRVFAHYVDDVELPAGPAVLVSEIIAEPTSRWFPLRKDVREKLTYVVFPHGCSDALKLTFTAAEEFGEKLEADATSVMNTLTVSLGEVRSR